MILLEYHLNIKKDYDDKKYVLPKAMSKRMDGTDVYQPIFTFKVLNKFLDLEAIRALYYRTMDRNELINLVTMRELV